MRTRTLLGVLEILGVLQDCTVQTRYSHTDQKSVLLNKHQGQRPRLTRIQVLTVTHVEKVKQRREQEKIKERIRDSSMNPGPAFEACLRFKSHPRLTRNVFRRDIQPARHIYVGYTPHNHFGFGGEYFLNTAALLACFLEPPCY